MSDLLQKKAKIEGFVESGDYRPMKAREMAEILSVPSSAFDLFEEILADMLAEGTLALTRKNKFISAAKVGLIKGPFSATAKGYGFVLRQDAPDIFIPADAICTAMHGDLVLCRIVEESSPSSIGEIISVVERAKQHFVGVFELGERGGWVMPDDKRVGPAVHIPWKFINDAKDGEKVRVKIAKFNDSPTPHEGRVEQVLGNPLDIGMDVLSLVVEHDIPYIFPDNVLNQAQSLPHKVSAADLNERRDFRDLPTVTIDGEDTKDIDDAISLARLENGGFRLYVHIADVSHYVAPGSPLWKEAQKRATSVYLADRVIPMLPPQISNGICSLNPNVDRLALSCVMDLDEDGRVISHEICKSVIHSDHAITYTTLAEILTEPDSPHRASYPEFFEAFKHMELLANMLRQKRLHKGALEFDFAECKILIDSGGNVVDILRRERSIATSIIEEFMICANEVVATEYFWMDLPFVYRVHEEPHKEKIEALMESLKTLGLSLRKGGGQAKNLQGLLSRAENLPQGAAVAKLILRSLKQARYSAQALGHFGLATEFYSHFTSPIRRFPDLMIHSIISANLAGKLDENYISLLRESLPDICKHSSENERRADDCAKDVEKLKKVQFMADKIGEIFEGIISHTTPGGFFVELENTVEGMVSISGLTDDYYEYFEDRYSFKGRKHGQSFSLGDRLTIKVAAAHLELRRLDFELVTN
ncbi:MAG: ribonuclease R [Clostridiales bacterium]|jgi:ribonuclease R|nr:ribonuclease R [Clostridiales bacterium]